MSTVRLLAELAAVELMISSTQEISLSIMTAALAQRYGDQAAEMIPAAIAKQQARLLRHQARITQRLAQATKEDAEIG